MNTVAQRIEFGLMQPGDKFIVHDRNILFGGVMPTGREYEKIATQQYGRGRQAREVNARTLDGTEHCWIAPCHEVDLI